MKKQDPAFLLYSADFLVGTIGFSDDQVGKYIRILCTQHQQGHLDARVMQKLCGGIEDEMILDKFKLDPEGKYFNQRLEDEIVKRASHRKKQVDNANMRWQCRGNTKALPKSSQNHAKTMPLEDENVIGIKSSLNKDIEKTTTSPEDPAAAAAFSFLAETLGMDLIQVSQVFKNHKLPYIQEKISLTRKRVEEGHLDNATGFFLASLSRDFKDNSDVSKKIEAAKELAKAKAQEERRHRIEMKLLAGLPINHQEYGMLHLERQDELKYDEEHFKKTQEWIYYDPKQKGELTHEEG